MTLTPRMKAAEICQDGACNPRPIATALRDGIFACFDEGGDPSKDPGVFLILHQLVWILTGDDFCLGDDRMAQRYDAAMRALANAKAAAQSEASSC